jgi:hypothetical protein
LWKALSLVPNAQLGDEVHEKLMVVRQTLDVQREFRGVVVPAPAPTQRSPWVSVIRIGIWLKQIQI